MEFRFANRSNQCASRGLCARHVGSTIGFYDALMSRMP